MDGDGTVTCMKGNDGREIPYLTQKKWLQLSLIGLNAIELQIRQV